MFLFREIDIKLCTNYTKIVECDLFKTTNRIQNLIHIRFGIILTQYYINFSRQEHQIDVLYVSFNALDSQVSSYTPFSFPLQSL